MALLLKHFKQKFSHEYPYISHSQTDEQIMEFLEKHQGESIIKVMDLYSDYLLSQNLCDVQE